MYVVRSGVRALRDTIEKILFGGGPPWSHLELAAGELRAMAAELYRCPGCGVGLGPRENIDSGTTAATDVAILDTAPATATAGAEHQRLEEAKEKGGVEAVEVAEAVEAVEAVLSSSLRSGGGRCTPPPSCRRRGPFFFGKHFSRSVPQPLTAHDASLCHKY